MATNAVKKNLYPETLVDQAAQLPLIEFMTLHGDTNFLLVRIDDPVGELVTSLSASDRTGDHVQAPRPNALAYNTVVHMDDPSSSVGNAFGFGVPELMRLLIKHAHYATPLRKRASEGTFGDRISVGRARNKDIVLRDPSVSKFHAWFEMDDQGRFYAADAGSKNGTRINGELVVARETHLLNPGDSIRIGSIESVLCPPDLFWGAVNPRA